MSWDKRFAVINCTNKEDFYEAIDFLVSKGLGFNADVDSLTISLTGGR